MIKKTIYKKLVGDVNLIRQTKPDDWEKVSALLFADLNLIYTKTTFGELSKIDFMNYFRTSENTYLLLQKDFELQTMNRENFNDFKIAFIKVTRKLFLMYNGIEFTKLMRENYAKE